MEISFLNMFLKILYVVCSLNRNEKHPATLFCEAGHTWVSKLARITTPKNFLNCSNIHYLSGSYMGHTYILVYTSVIEHTGNPADKVRVNSG